MGFLDRLKKKYGFSSYSGQNYRQLMSDVLANNYQHISNAVGKLSDSHWTRANKRIKRDKQLILPDISEVLPKEEVFIKKSAEQGEIITDTLRDELSQNLRDALSEFKTAKTGEQAFIRRRGTKAGTINPKLVAEFQDRIVKTFENYTKIDPRFGVPSNIKTIAVTEARSTINDMKHSYNQELLKKNPNVKMEKQWIQNKELSKKPREGHAQVHGKRIPAEEKFIVPRIVNGQLQGTDAMDRPHDSNAPLEQVAGCNCDIKYFIIGA